MVEARWRGKFPLGRSTRQCKISSLKKSCNPREKTRISKLFGWISEMSLCFGYPDEKWEEKKMVERGMKVSQRSRLGGKVSFHRPYSTDILHRRAAAPSQIGGLVQVVTHSFCTVGVARSKPDRAVHFFSLFCIPRQVNSTAQNELPQKKLQFV